jgi:hypothetical protein
MPFTFSHPAIVLPLTFLPRHWFSLTGLIIGSLTPDFEYFMRMRIESNYSHTFGGIFWFDIPLGIILAYIFHHIVRDRLFDNLPTVLRSRLSRFQHFDWHSYFKTNWLVVLISVFIGAVSHLFWDSFTHDHGYFVQNIPALTNTMDILGFQVLVLKILQHASTFVGGLVILFAFFRLTPDKDVTGKLNLFYWGIFTTLTLTIIVLRLFNGLDINQYGNVIVTAISAGLISLIVAPLFMWKINNKER